jgi:hypothetical protein
MEEFPGASVIAIWLPCSSMQVGSSALSTTGEVIMNTNAAPRFPTAFALIAAGSLMAAVPSIAGDDDHGRRFATHLSGYNEVHFNGGNPAGSPPTAGFLRGAISTKAKGKFKAKISDDQKIIEYELEYEGLKGDVTQAHIHFGQKSTVGGIVVWLCQTSGTPAPAAVAGVTPACPASGKVTGTIQPFQVLSQEPQGFEGDFDELVRAIRAGATYANVHSSLFGPGEIRGQIEKRDHRDHHRH